VLVIGLEAVADGVALQQLAGGPGVLAQDDIGGGQGLERPDGHVTEMADGCGDHMEAG
jgi:hypothetical protein